MKSGTSGSSRHGRSLPIYLASLVMSGVALAQQPAAQELPVPSANLPAAQTVGQAAANAPKSDKEKSDPQTSDWSTMTKLGVGDLLEIAVYNVPELNAKVRVSNAGDVYLPLIDYVHVEGLTQEEAKSLIAKRLEYG